MTSRATPEFHERLLPGPGGWLGTAGLGVIAGIVPWPFNPPLGVATAILVGAIAAIALATTSPVVRVSAGVLQAGRASIPLSRLGDPAALDATAMRWELGPGLDARAYVCLRAWARTGVRIPVEDPHDPTPYWLVSTRDPRTLVAVLSGTPAS
ncbi:DUF3093 domain-containing protein [Myceligenerans salitolerans]|uniref:DUF3093 domain-containing protein n=1 Tax=Myceligenerans salitolerans TaxID=1230528 RepID=A0ABS3ICL5_9MICO|nr:DUF3093 domain-containing protein [Myceligenerans salitolerans]MBO0610670.1 DUF3093 domain-containing protein [Myceligenerans salitolerans]